jgi:hypothetical protein
MTFLYALGMSVQNLMNKSVCISNSDPSCTTLTGIYYNAGHGRVQHRIASIKRSISSTDIVEIDATVWICRAYRPISRSKFARDVGRHPVDRRQHTPHNFFPCHVLFPILGCGYSTHAKQRSSAQHGSIIDSREVTSPQ